MPENSTSPRMADVPRNLKPYFLCLLRKGPQWDIPQDHEDLMPLQLAFLRRRTEEGKILMAGPILGQPPGRSDGLTGISVIHAANLEEAKALANEDPAVRAERLIAEVHPVFLPSLDGVRIEY
jgi:uncharacterized protein YciI